MKLNSIVFNYSAASGLVAAGQPLDPLYVRFAISTSFFRFQFLHLILGLRFELAASRF